MDENDNQIGTDCMKEIQEVLKKHGCGIEIIVGFSSLHGQSFLYKVFPMKNIVVAKEMPNIKIGDN